MIDGSGSLLTTDILERNLNFANLTYVRTIYLHCAITIQRNNVMSFKIGSFNVRGLKETSKLTFLVSDIEYYKIDVCCLQETHLTETISSNKKRKILLFHQRPNQQQISWHRFYHRKRTERHNLQTS